MSETGAMIDGAALPDVGTALILRRLAVDIGATVVWHADGRCGIRFGGLVSIDEWVAGERQAQGSGTAGQARVDAIQLAIRSGTSLPQDIDPSGRSVSSSKGLDHRIVEELLYVTRLLHTFGDDLVKDPMIVQRYGKTLQNFDAACEILDHLSRVMGAEHRAEAAAAVSMQTLRKRLLAKPIL